MDYLRYFPRLLLGSPLTIFGLLGCTGGYTTNGIFSGNSTSTPSFVWTDQTSAGNQQWVNVAASADGMKLVAATAADDADWTTTGYVYTSANGGVSWIKQSAAGSYVWTSVASSADGTKLASLASATDQTWTTGGSIYTSTDSGLTWNISGSGQKEWVSIASSADGNILAATGYGWPVYISTDAGTSWAATSSVNPASSGALAMSSDGQKISFAVAGGDIYTSADGGTTWIDRSVAGSRTWSAITSSSDGTKLVAVTQCSDSSCSSSGGDIYTSLDSGATWIDQTAAGSRTWSAVTSSSDGLIVAATVYCLDSTTACAGTNGDIYVSMDGGNTWIDQTSAGAQAWNSIKLSSDGKTLIAAIEGGDMWTATYTASVTTY